MSGVKFIWTSHPRFPLPPLGSPKTSSLNISLLDSSFNPPTLAHLALASHPSPPALPPFNAHILALSAKNVDKPGADGLSVQLRLEMMQRTAQEMVRRAGEEGAGDGIANVGVILLEEPTFVGKSTAVKRALDDRIQRLLKDDGMEEVGPSVRLSFVIGELFNSPCEGATRPPPSLLLPSYQLTLPPPRTNRLGHTHSCLCTQILPISLVYAFHSRPFLRGGGEQLLVRTAGRRACGRGGGLPRRGRGQAVG